MWYLIKMHQQRIPIQHLLSIYTYKTWILFVCLYVGVFRRHRKSQGHEILDQGLIWTNLRHDKAWFSKFWFLRGGGPHIIHKFKNEVFVHDFLIHQSSELPEIWNLSKHWTNLKNNKDRFSKFGFLPFLRQFFDFLVVISVFMKISPHSTIKFWQSEYF